MKSLMRLVGLGALGYIILKLESLEEGQMRTNERLAGVADRVLAGLGGLAATTEEIKGDLAELKQMAADEEVSAETLAKFDDIDTKVGALATSLREAADVVPEPTPTPETTPDTGGSTSGSGDGVIETQTLPDSEIGGPPPARPGANARP